jgi:peptidoglycan/xylan/chitin deacetylase (PgdA/CDA1 family)
LTPHQFRQDLRRASAAIEAACGIRPIGYRAPSWSISPPMWTDAGDNFWALRILREEGFEYDSSLFPAKNYLYGVANAPLHAHRIDLDSLGTLVEIPATVAELPLMRLPFGGGFYLRLLPLAITTLLCRDKLRRTGQPFMVYVHPREMSDEQPRLRLGRVERFIHYHNLRANLRKLERLFDRFRFAPIREYLRAHGAQLPMLHPSVAASVAAAPGEDLKVSL